MKKNSHVKNSSQQSSLKRPIDILYVTVLLLVITCLPSFTVGSRAFETYGKKNKGKKILIVYDSKYGSTTDYVVRIAQGLSKYGYRVDYDRVLNLLDTDISSYDGYIIAAAIYFGNTLPGYKNFLDTHRTTLAGKPVAYCHNALNKASTGNSSPATFWCFGYQELIKNYPEIFPLPAYTCNTCPNCSNLPEVPYWVGLMPGRWIPRNGFPTDYIAMEIGGYGGLKDYERLKAADEYTQRLLTNHFFEP
jgi:flavodoxin